jgi:hypothetical protein
VAARDLPVEVQERLVERADVLSVGQLGQAVREAQFDHGLVPADPVPQLSLTTTDSGGRIDAGLDAEGFELVHRALDTIVDDMDLRDLPIEQRRAAAFVAMARHHLECPKTVTNGRPGLPHVMALVPLETLEARTGGSATLASGAVISGDTARRIACDAGITRIITRGTSEILDVGRTSRAIPAAIAKAVIARDRHCTHPGCTAPPWLCEIHHILRWALGGTTSLDNLRLLCWFHHQLEHEHEHRQRDAA